MELVIICVEKGLPLRFLICSRPEHAIQTFFHWEALISATSELGLKRDSQTDRDIELFLYQKLHDIRIRHSHYTFPHPWPTSEVIEDLVNKSDGQFIYASTVVKYI